MSSDTYLSGRITLFPQYATNGDAYNRALADALNAHLPRGDGETITETITPAEAQEALAAYVNAEGHCITSDDAGYLGLFAEDAASSDFAETLPLILSALGDGDLRINWNDVEISGLRLVDGQQITLDHHEFLATVAECQAAWTEIAQAASNGEISQETATLLQHWLGV